MTQTCHIFTGVTRCLAFNRFVNETYLLGDRQAQSVRGLTHRTSLKVFWNKSFRSSDGTALVATLEETPAARSRGVQRLVSAP